jgi:hypothetical protein
VNQWLNPLKVATGSNLVDAGRAAAHADRSRWSATPKRRHDPDRQGRRKLNELRSLGWTIAINPDGTTTLTPPATAA